MITQLKKYGPINVITLTRTGGSDSIYYPENLPSEIHEIKIEDNLIMNGNDRSQYLPDIYNKLNGLSYYINDFSSPGITYLDFLDRYNVSIGENTYSCVLFNDEVLITQGLEENIYTDMPEETVTEYKYASSEDKAINSAYIIVKKNEAEIEAVANRIVDVSKETTGLGTITLENAHEGQLYKLNIKGNVSLLFPQSESNLYGYPIFASDENVASDDLYASSDVPYGNEIIYPTNTIYPKGQILIVDDKEYKLDFDFLNYMSSAICDEFVYDNGICYIIRKVGINEDGEMYQLENEVIESRKGIVIDVKSNSIITLKSFPNSILTAKYLLENEYTDNFATEVEVQSSINISADEIKSEVSATYETKDNAVSNYSRIDQTTNQLSLEVGTKVGEDEIISKINQTPETISIDANKVNLTGYVTATDLAGTGTTTINGSNITTGTLSADRVNGGTLTGTTFNANGKVIIGSSGTLTINADNEEDSRFIIRNEDTQGPDTRATITPSFFQISDRTHNCSYQLSRGVVIPSGGSIYYDYYSDYYASNGYSTGISATGLSMNTNSQTTISARTATGAIRCVSLTQTSREEEKKNFEIYENALEEVLNTDIYKYNLNFEEDNHKKHVGFIIGENRNYSKDITAVDEDNKEIGVDTYSMVSVLWKAVQEQQEIIENLQSQINELKESDNNE